MKASALFGLVALLPVALNASAAPSVLLAGPTCGGMQRTITVPLAPNRPGETDRAACRAKACHAGGCRKRYPRAT